MMSVDMYFVETRSSDERSSPDLTRGSWVFGCVDPIGAWGAPVNRTTGKEIMR